MTDHGHTHTASAEVSIQPTFKPGAMVVLRDAAPEQYKRRPDYAEGAQGVIEHVHGAYVPPTEQDETEPEHEYLYSVRFEHSELFGESHPESNGSVHIDIWETALAQAK